LNTQASFTINAALKELDSFPALQDSLASIFSEFSMTADPNPSAVQRPKVWKTILLLAGSAAFGGVAVALWNRRELARMHEQANNPAAEQELPAEEDVY
jgi:hypothetical protein